MGFGTAIAGTRDSDIPCDKCGTSYVYIKNGKCTNCFGKNRAVSPPVKSMELVNRRRKLLKEKEENEINNNYYFEG